MDALQELAREDPSFGADPDPECGQIILKGMSEHHLDTKVNLLRSRHRVDVNIGAPQVAYRETVTRRAETDYTYKKQTGDGDRFARVKLAVEPGGEKSGVVLETAAVGGAVPDAYLAAMETGIQSVVMSGCICGFPITDITVTLVDGAGHETGSSTIAFETAAREALRQAIARAGPVLLEPIMALEIVSPEDCLGAVTGDLNSRRGQIADTTSRGAAQVVNAQVPLASMFGYGHALDTLSQGRATYEMAFDRYAEVSRTSDNPGPDDTSPAAMAMRA